MAAIAVALMLVRSLVVADRSWDTLSYHLPFSAMRIGMLKEADFIFPLHLTSAYLGFPSAIYYLKGILWFVTGRAETTQIVSLLAALVFVTFVRRILQAPLEWTVIGVLSIPTIQIGLTGNGTDVPANFGLAMMFLSLYKLSIKPTQINTIDLIYLLIASLIASGSKPQAVVIGCVMFACYAITFIMFNCIGKDRSRKQLPNKNIIFWLIFCGLAISYPAIINAIQYGNPIYPMIVNIGTIHFNGSFTANSWNDPAYLSKLPQQIRWLLSVLELRAYDLRPIPYVIDQGNVPLTANSFRMGGYFSPLILMSLFAIIFASIKTSQKEYIRGLIPLSIVTIVVSSLPGSSELRYYSFWAISIVVIAIKHLEMNKDNLELQGVYSSFKVFLIISFVFVVSITGGEYFKWSGGSYTTISNMFPKGKRIIGENNAVVICYGEDFRGAIFESIVFSKEKNVLMLNQETGICSYGNTKSGSR